MSELVIRKFEPKDQEQVADLYAHGMESYAHIPIYYQVTSNRVHNRVQPGGDIHDVQSSYMDKMDGGRKRCMWVAEYDGKIVGMIGAVPSTKYNPNEYLELVRMSVSPTCRNMGVGSKLIKVLEDWAVQEGYKHVNLFTLEKMFLAVALYTRNGYEVKEMESRDVTKEIGAQEQTSINMLHFVKDLA